MVASISVSLADIDNICSKDMKYKVDFINQCYRRFFAKHRKDILASLTDCLASGRLTLREDVWSLEKKIAKVAGTKYCATVNSGTDALFLSLKALGVGPGDEVISVSNTFVATLQAIVHCGATPILIDVKEDELMDLDQLEKAITKKTKVIIPVQYTGAVCDMERMNKILEKYPHIKIVDDYCQALGAKQNGKKVGSFGVLNAVSFNTAKLMGGLCDGGAVTTDDRELYEKICLLRNHWNVHQLSVDRNDYPQPEEMGWGWKSRLSNVNAAFINVKMKTLSFILKRREQIAKQYNKAFKDLPLTTPHEQKGRVWQEYHLQVEDRDGLAKSLKEKGIETLVRDIIPNHKMKGLGLEKWKLPVTEKLARRVMRLPLHEHLKDNEVEYVISCVKKFYDRRI